MTYYEGPFAPTGPPGFIAPIRLSDRPPEAQTSERIGITLDQPWVQCIPASLYSPVEELFEPRRRPIRLVEQDGQVCEMLCDELCLGHSLHAGVNMICVVLVSMACPQECRPAQQAFGSSRGMDKP